MKYGHDIIWKGMIIMRLLINKKDLALLLEQKRDYIGNRVAVDTVIAGISFLLSAFTASYNDIFFASSITLKYLFCFISVLYMLKIARDLIEMHSDSYNHTKLMKDIEDLDMIQHKHSLIVIKRNENQKASKFLLYYDEKWDCKLFLNCKTADRNNEQNIISRIAEDFNIDARTINCHYVVSRVQEKYSVSHNEDRVYQHRLYEVSFEKMPELVLKEDFVLNNRHYYWMSIEDMEKDENIIQKNLEVVDFVKENIL